jgi:uncharacterized protein DUF1360
MAQDATPDHLDQQDKAGSPGGGPITAAFGEAREQKAAYAQGEDRPLGGYLLLMAAYGAGALGLSGLVRAGGRGLPERIGAADLALIGVATHKCARLLAKDPVTSPLRAPFTAFKGTSGPAELQEEPRGRGLRKAVGELIVCPFCVGQWVATGFVFGLVLRPRATRLVASLFAALTVADFLQFAYAAAEKTESS